MRNIFEKLKEEEKLMREVLEEYGKMVLAVITEALLLGFTTIFLTEGQFYEAIQTFSQSIC